MTATIETLKNRDYTLIIDKSGSMVESDVKGFASRWAAAREATLGLAAKITELDPDGITVYAFNNHFKRHDNVTQQAVAQVWQEHEPNGGTDLDNVLNDALNGPQGYFTRKAKGETKPNGEVILVITDGAPNDRKAVERTIVAATKKMDRDEELGIEFVQVGSDKSATEYLKHLDNDLQPAGAKFDIVNTMTIDEMGDRSLTDVLLSALND